MGSGKQRAGAALTAVRAGCVRTAGALLSLMHGVALVKVVAREAVRFEPGGRHGLELQLVILVENADQRLTEGTRHSGAASGTAGDHEAHVQGLVVLLKGLELLVGACHEHAALTGVVGAQVAACATACGGGCVTAVQCHAQCRVQLVLGLRVKDALVGSEGAQLCATAASAGNGYDGDCAVADELDRGGAAAGRAVHVAAIGVHYLRCAGCGAGAGGVAAGCVAFATECGLRAGYGADAAVTRPDAQDVAGLDRKNTAELCTGTAASQGRVRDVGQVSGSKGRCGTASTSHEVESYSSNAFRDEPFGVCASLVVEAGCGRLEGQSGGAGGLAACRPCRDGCAGEDNGGTPCRTLYEATARNA